MGVPKDNFYPPIEPNQTGFLEVSKAPPHKLYWEEYGDPNGEPVLFIHGGPGAGCVPEYAKFFDPEHYRIILFDQRGAGKSTPSASLENNTTQHSIEDITKLRDHLDINGKMHLFGGSWGSTLSLAYAIEHPDTVQSMALRGIFLCRKEDIDIFYQGDATDLGNSSLMGSGRYFPKEWREYVEFIPKEERHDMVAAYHKRLFGNDKALQLKAAQVWSIWEAAASKLVPDKDLTEQHADAAFALKFARIENEYFMHGGFLDKDASRTQNFIIENLHKVLHIPTEIVQGRYDMVCPQNQAARPS